TAPSTRAALRRTFSRGSESSFFISGHALGLVGYCFSSACNASATFPASLDESSAISWSSVLGAPSAGQAATARATVNAARKPLFDKLLITLPQWLAVVSVETHGAQDCPTSKRRWRERIQPGSTPDANLVFNRNLPAEPSQATSPRQ